MAIVYTALLAVAAFLLGAVPFSVIIGRWLLDKDITGYGDGNPGAVNVFRAGGQKTGFLAIFMDVAKGFPFVFLAHTLVQLSELSVVIIAISAVVGGLEVRGTPGAGGEDEEGSVHTRCEREGQGGRLRHLAVLR